MGQSKSNFISRYASPELDCSFAECIVLCPGLTPHLCHTSVLWIQGLGSLLVYACRCSSPYLGRGLHERTDTHTLACGCSRSARRCCLHDIRGSPDSEDKQCRPRTKN
jgi:hypothetical protein